MSRLAPAALSTVLVAVIVLAGHTEIELVAAAVVLVQLLIATGPDPADRRGRSVRTPKLVAVAVAGLIATVLTVRPQWLQGTDGTEAGEIAMISAGSMAAVLPAIAAGLILVLLSQMLRRDGRPALVSSTGYAVSLTMFAALAIGWISAVQAVNGAEVVTVGAAALVAALAMWCVPIDRWLCGSLAIVAGAVGGAVAALVVDSHLTWFFGVTVGSMVGLFAVLGQVLGRAWTEGRRRAAPGWGFPGALSVALVAPVVHVGGQLVTSL